MSVLKPVFPMHQRLRKRTLAWEAALARAVGNHPFVAGIAGTAVAVAMAGLTFVSLYAGRADALTHAHETSQSLVAIIGSDLERNIEIYNLSLRAMVDGAQRPLTWQLSPGLRQAVLFDRATDAGYLGGAYILGTDGKVKAEQSGEINPLIGLGDRDYFLVHQRGASVGLFISHPFRSRLRDHKLSIGLTRRIDAPTGQFAGVALLAIRIEYFQHLLDKINTGPSGSVFISLDDGTLLARKPLTSNEIGTSIVRSPVFAYIAGHSSAGSFVTVSAIDGVTRMYTYARVPGTPLLAVVAPAIDDILASWRKRSAIAAVLTFALAMVVIAVSWLLAFAVRDKILAEGELLRLAATDPLTGLANRRTLDQRLDEAWLHSRRNGEPLSALFIDIDYFKRFNDTHGHAAGDEVIAAVADCVASTVRRSIDVVARYGGEEFAVILPGTPAAGAARLAEKIRRTVESLRFTHAPGTQEAVTVSIGSASCVPSNGGTALELLAAADERLYAAKAAGRNQVMSFVRPENETTHGASS
ncbi:sensor domain-containing diguanylate cyclase [Paraburkholderia acidicola]